MAPATPVSAAKSAPLAAKTALKVPRAIRPRHRQRTSELMLRTHASSKNTIDTNLYKTRSFITRSFLEYFTHEAATWKLILQARAPQLMGNQLHLCGVQSAAKMMSELECLEANNSAAYACDGERGSRLATAAAHAAYSSSMYAIADDPVQAAELTGRAKAVIYRLAGELEQLALQADHDYKHVMPLSQRFDIASLLNQIHLDWIDEASAKHLQLSLAAEAVVESDHNLLSAIMGNVVGNAVRYTSTGEVCVDCALEDRDVLITVRDTGPGISEWDLQRSFVQASCVEGLSVGLGRGLSIARRTAEVLGHEFGVASTPERGTCISLRVSRSGNFSSNNPRRIGDPPCSFWT